MSAVLTFLGKADITEQEYDDLHMLGRAMALGDVLLQTSTIGAANQAVAEGYLSEGYTPTLKTKGVLELRCDGMLVYADDTLMDQLAQVQSLISPKDPSYITNQDELTQYTEAALAVLAIKGQTGS